MPSEQGAPTAERTDSLCCCGHPHSEHEFCSDDYPSVCMADDGIDRGDPIASMCPCLIFEAEDV